MSCCVLCGSLQPLCCTHRYNNYIRYDGEIAYRAEEIAQQARMLTILALYYSYSEGDRSSHDPVNVFMLSHFAKAKAVAEFLAARRTTSLVYPESDPRHGMIAGLDEGDTFTHMRYHQDPKGSIHWCVQHPVLDVPCSACFDVL